MKKIIMILMIAVGVSLVAFGQTKMSNDKKGDEQAVRQIINDLAAALGKNDVAALDRIYAADYVLTTENGEMTDKATRLAAIKSGALKFESVNFTEIKVNVYGNAAVARFRGTSKVQSAGAQPLGGNLRVTATLVRTKGGWHIVAAHSTRVAGQ